MGEYAKRNSDGEHVKIGTCECMYYLRYEDRNKVSPLPGSLNPNTELNLYWRLPFPDEDRLLPGEYEEYKRGLRLYKMVPDGRGREWAEDFTLSDEGDDLNPGIIQLHHKEAGLLLNVPCYHGMKLPEVGPGMKAFWNGKGHSFELSSVKNTSEGVLPIIRCRHCGNAWLSTWEEVLPYVGDKEMRKRLGKYKETA